MEPLLQENATLRGQALPDYILSLTDAGLYAEADLHKDDWQTTSPGTRECFWKTTEPRSWQSVRRASGSEKLKPLHKAHALDHA